LSVLFFLFFSGVMPTSGLLAFVGSGIIVAGIGFLDDHRHIPARWRLLAHFSAAIFGLYWLGGLPPIEVFGNTVNLSWLGHGLALLFLVWLLNLYNFMDGIDGIASIEAITTSIGGAALVVLSDSAGNETWQPLIMLAATVAGFLIWNFPPAKIFMGDAGSGFLGIALGLFSIQAAWLAPRFFWSWLILLAVFIVDATLTLFRRLIRKERLYQAHCSHAYQHAARFYSAHKPVSLAVAAINTVWLFPLALCVGLGYFDGLSTLMLACLPLLCIALRFNAGLEITDL
jgi:Fuc2NAc and GlcNAc transferase